MRRYVAHKSGVPTPKVRGQNQVRGQIVPKIALLVNY